MTGTDLFRNPVHLGLGACAVIQPDFAGDMDWYAAYGARHAADGAEGRLVALHSFSEPWTSWECHPHGAEVVLCISGKVTLIQEEADGAKTAVALGEGQYAINPPGVWHTADADGPATCLFITAGKDTTHRPR